MLKTLFLTQKKKVYNHRETQMYKNIKNSRNPFDAN